MEYQEILYDTSDGVATITINRPDTLNALTSLTQAEIRHSLFISDTTEEVVGTVITGSGRGFCSGVDMKSLGKISDDGKRTENLSNSDVILLGVSRTSKTPTSIYLANRGFKLSLIHI